MSQTHTIGKTATTVANGVVTYHATQIFKLSADGASAEIWHGGWVTATTANRLNQAFSVYAFPFHVWRRKDTMWIGSAVTKEERAILEPVTIGKDGKIWYGGY